jgi:hypothetical protein
LDLVIGGHLEESWRRLPKLGLPRYLHVHIDLANERTTVEETPEGFRFVKLWLEGDRTPHTWNEPYNGA